MTNSSKHDCAILRLPINLTSKVAMEAPANGGVIVISTPSTLKIGQTALAGHMTGAVMTLLFAHTVHPLSTTTVGVSHGVLHKREASPGLLTPCTFVPLTEARGTATTTGNKE